MGGKRLGRQLPLQVVTPEEVFDHVDQASSCAAGIFAEGGEASVFLIGGRRNIDLPQATDGLACQQALLVDPEQFAQCCRVPPIGLLLFSFFGLDEDHLVAAVVAEHADQPIVEATDFEHGDERFIATQPLAGEVLKESVDFLRLRGDLPSLQDIAILIAE